MKQSSFDTQEKQSLIMRFLHVDTEFHWLSTLNNQTGRVNNTNKIYNITIIITMCI